MEFVPRHPHALPPPTGPDHFPCGVAVSRLGPLSPPDRVPARAGPPPGRRQTHHLPHRSPPTAWRVSASCRALPSPYRRWRTPARDHVGAHEQLATGGTPLRMGLSANGTHRLPGQCHRRLHRRLPQRRAADGEGFGVGMLIQPLGRLRARSIAGLFPQPPSEPDMKLIASSGSPVPLSR
jgi:hypothetical protein